MKLLIFISILLISFIEKEDPGNWELRRNENGIAIYSQKQSNNSFKQIKVECELPGTTNQLISVIKDVPHHRDWVYASTKATILKKNTENNFIYHTETDMPWPVTDRDLVAETIIYPVTRNGQLRVEVKSRPDYLPVKKGFVRVPYSLAIWEVLQLPGNKLKVTYTFSIDPAGAIPHWLLNATITTGPYNTFMKLREILRKKQA